MPSVAILGTRGYPSYYGGFETAVRKIAPYLADEGWDVTVYSRPGATRPDDPHRDNRVRVIETWGIERKSLSTLTYGLTAARHAARQKPDVALVMNFANGYWLPILKRAGIPTLVNVDGIEWDRAKWGRVAKRVFHTGAKWTARYSTRLVYDSQEIGRRWEAEFNRSGLFIPYGGEILNADLPLEPGLAHRGYVLVVARLVPENTIQEFFEAAQSIAQTTDIVIVGSSGYGGKLDAAAEKLAATHERVRWLGHVSDDQRLNSLWQHAGAYFHGHSVGGTNPALVQALACGAPVMARDTSYNIEVLADPTQTCGARPEQIAAAVSALMLDETRKENASARNRERAHTNYSWRAVCAAYDAALRETSGAHARTAVGMEG